MALPVSLLRVSGFPRCPLRYLLSKGAILFYAFPLLQSFWLLSLHPAHFMRASLEVFFPSAFAVSGLCLSGLPSPNLSALRLFQPFSGFLLSLSGLFHPVTLLGFPFRAFSFKRLVSSFEAPCPPAVGCFAYVFAISKWLRFHLNLHSGSRVLFPLEARSHRFGS